MERTIQTVFSMRMMALAMLIFLLSIALATFIESTYDIQTAKIMIYNALWFEILLVYLAVNLIANVFRYQMYKREKVSMLVFHLSFLLILLGAGVTRYFGYEGLMLIREGEQSDFIYSSEPYLWFKINDGKLQYTNDHKLYLSEHTNNEFNFSIEFPNHKEKVKIEYLDFLSNRKDSLVMNDSIKSYVLELVTEGMKSNYLAKGEFLMSGDLPISFEKKDALEGVSIFDENGKILVQSNFPMQYLPMSQMMAYRQSGREIPDSVFVKVPAHSKVPFQTTTLYQIGGQQIVFKDKIRNAKKMLLPATSKDGGADYVKLKITDGGISKEVLLKGGMGAIPDHEVFALNGLTYEMEYGSKKIQLPFAIACRDFQLDRYPGSQTPSSFASEVTVIDPKNNHRHDQRIFMNNVMDYGGYRFFQSSYDTDEKGTRLSVNHDWWGTNITYLGYLLMAIGMAFSVVAKNGRIKELINKLKRSSQNHSIVSNVLLIFALSFSFSNFSQQDHHGHHHEGHDHNQKKAEFGVISKEHSKVLSSLLVQDFEGRIAPMHTICLNLLRKVHRGDKFENYDAVQTIMSMHMYPQAWLEKKVIYISANLRERFGVKGKHASMRDLVDQHYQFKLLGAYKKAHQKLESQRDEFDKNIIKLVDRFEIMQSFASWAYMRIVPLRNDAARKWYNPIDEVVYKTDSSAFFTTMAYLKELFVAKNTNNYQDANKKLDQLKDYQKAVANEYIPSTRAVQVEITYNRMNIFKNSSYMYLLLGFTLLILFFGSIFSSKGNTSKSFNVTTKIIQGILFFTFIYHAVGLGFRWYISGHAPWSNGYEAIVFIAWSTMFAGFLFSNKNKVIIAATAILAFLMLFVSEMNLLDPEVSPLQPVLKSYWLMIHVAVITSSYGFLGLGAILGLLNLILYIFKSEKSKQKVQQNINELTYVNEITLTIGLFMLTIGTFLGGIWANESWGRYWGWDPKETWALVSVLVYAVILHLRFIPALRSKFVFNLVSFWGYSAILFTFFGVNFMLVGLHSYAQGDGVGDFPSWLNYTILVFYILSEVAWMRYKIPQSEFKYSKKYFIIKAGLTIFIPFLLGLICVALDFADLKGVILKGVIFSVFVMLFNYIQFYILSVKKRSLN